MSYQYCICITHCSESKLDRVCPLRGGKNQINQVINQKAKAYFFLETLKQKYDWSHVGYQLENKKIQQIMSSLKWMV